MEESRSDGLEIISIGEIYTGDWDKKYWSSSRGKDRYPFPIGYKAVRTHNAITYQMEVHEGSKGPSFLISSSDGHSCSGQTPDMAWDIFQKKGCPQIKLWRGKRFSCKIDGVEFFGFKNVLVQRLLRELGTNHGITAEHSGVTSSLINDDSAKENQSSCTEITGPATLTNLKIPQVKGKRTRKPKSTNPNSTSAASCKKIRPEDEVLNDCVLDEDKVHNNQKDHNNNNNKHIPSLVTSVSNKEHEIHNDDKDSVMSLNLETVIEVKSIPSSVNDGLLVVSSPSSDHHPEGEEAPLREDTPVNSLLTGTTEYLSIYKNPLVRPTTENEESNLLVPEEPKDGEVSVATETESTKDVNLCVPDSLDSLQDKTCHSQLNLQKKMESPCNKQCKLVAEVESVTISETSTSNSNSEKSDFDSVGDDIAKSMMSFLLPQALPLLSSKKKSPVLKTFSRKKRRVLKPLETFIGSEKIQKEMKEIDNRDSVSPGMHAKDLPLVREAAAIVNDSLDVFSFRNEASIVPDSFLSVEALCDVPQAKVATIDDNHNRSNALEELSECYNGTGFSNENCEGQKLLVETHKVIRSDSVLGDLSSTENKLHRSNDDMCKNGEDCLCHEIHSKEKFPETSLETDEDNLTRQNKGPLSESIICRNPADDFVLHTNGSSQPMFPSVSHPVSLLNNFDEDNVSMEKSVTSCSRSDNVVAEGLCAKPQMKLGNFDEQQSLRFMGRYVHPFPISLVLLSSNEEEVCICVLCGASVDQERNLFMYKLSTKEQIFGSPSFVGHTALILPLLKDAFKREISVDRTCLQLTPDGHSLVVLNSVKAPWCREGDLKCLCSACISNGSENTGISVLQVKPGYVSVVVKLTTAEVQCILVCEPNYLIGVEESGILRLWVMNSTWSALIEECDLSTSDCIFPCIVELKKIPNHSSLVIGHNGFGEFGLWDIDKRVFVARFSSPSTSVYQFLPISVFRWQRKDSIITKPHDQGKEQSTDNMASTRRSLLKQDENQSYNPLESDGVAIWILISTICNSDIQHDVQSSEHNNTVGLWKLALVVENTVILGSALDPRAVAVGSSSDNGIIGTKDGAVYMWDLCSGTKLCDLHHFQGVGVSTIATDDSKLGPIAIVGGDQLLVYVHSSQGVSNATSDKQELQKLF